MRVLLTGATGAAGLAILRSLLADDGVTHVTTLTRRPLPSWIELPDGQKAAPPHGSPTHPKLTALTTPSFLEYPAGVRAALASQDACIWALGTSTSGKEEKEYTELTVGYLESALAAFKEAGVGSAEKPFRFVFVSGEGADSSEKSRMLFARVKGRAENILLKHAKESSGAFKAFVMRPGYFFPSSKFPQDALHQRGAVARVGNSYVAPLFFGLLPMLRIATEDLGRFATEAAKGRWDGKGPIFDNREMKAALREAKLQA